MPLKAQGINAVRDIVDGHLEKYRRVLKNKGLRLNRQWPQSDSYARNVLAREARSSKYGATGFNNRWRGCETATVQLHPHPEWSGIELPKSATEGLPTALADIKPCFKNQKFISGHVINEKFGGNGLLWKNQTILTSGANSRHRKFDNTAMEVAAEMYNVCYRMLRVSQADDREEQMAKIYKSWAVIINATVDAESWYDTASDALQRAFLDDDGYPLTAVSTEIIFKARIKKPLTLETIADLKIPEENMDSILRGKQSVEHNMPQIARFPLRQPVPETADGKSVV